MNRTLPAYLVRRGLRRLAQGLPRLRGRGRLIDATRKLVRPPTGKVLTEAWPGVWMELDLDSNVERSIYYFGAYRPKVMACFLDLIRPGATVVDVGANVGSYTLAAAQQVGPTGRVVAFEADPDVFRRLIVNVELNQLENVLLDARAISDSEGVVSFHRNAKSDDNQGQGSIAREDHHREAIAVPCIDLATALDQLGNPSVDAIKIDTQGAELRVISGAKSVIEEDRPMLFWRSHQEKSAVLGDDPAAIIEYLLGLGYCVSEILQERGTLVPVDRPVTRDDGTFVACPR